MSGSTVCVSCKYRVWEELEKNMELEEMSGI